MPDDSKHIRYPFIQELNLDVVIGNYYSVDSLSRAIKAKGNL